jgi:Ca-activated chloride channel family protein
MSSKYYNPSFGRTNTMKRPLLSLVIAAFILSLQPRAVAQGILIPENTRWAPFPMPVAGPHPLIVKSLRIETRIKGQVATTRVHQTFYNDLNFTVDGTFFYPLPEDATFVDFTTWDGDRKLRGEVLEREQARNRYLSIVRRCWDPGLLEYAGANLFQARLFPVPARGEKRVEFAYSQILRADSGVISYQYPLHSGTRANPRAIGSSVFTVEIESDQGIRTVYSPTHTIDIHREGDYRARISFEAKDAIPDRHFQLYYSLSNSEFGVSAVTYRDAAEDGYFMLLLSPGTGSTGDSVIPKDILFVLDTSGSMQDKGKLDKALSALKFGVRSLNPHDRFNITTFSTETRKFRDTPVTATQDVKDAAIRFIENQSASGGTNIHAALTEAFTALQTVERPRYIIFLTDGLPTVGETDAGRILKETSSRNGRAVRVFTFGVGYDVNTFLLDQIAARNRGTSDYVTPDEDLEVKLSSFFTKVSSPVMTDLQLDPGGLQVADVYPKQIGDLFRGSQITVLGRYSNSGRFPVTFRGTVAGQNRTVRSEPCEFPGTSTANDFLPRLWAMRKVGYLLEQIRISGENTELKNEIVRLATKYGFVTPYTSYLAADERDFITGRMPHPVAAPARLQMSVDMGAGNAAPAAEAVHASMALREMKTSDIAATQIRPGTKQVGAKTFVLKDGTWTDIDCRPDAKMKTVDLIFGSDALLQAVAADRELAAYAALGKAVTVVHRGRIYRIHP